LTEAGTLEVGGTVTGSLAKGERHTWAFEGTAGQRINIRVRGDWDSTIELIPPNGTESIAVDFNSGGGWQAFLCSQLLPRAGTYRAVVSGYLGLPDKDFGEYTLTIEEENYIEDRPIAYDETVETTLTTCDGDFYVIDVEAGDTLQVMLTPESGAEMYLRLLPDRYVGNPLAFGSDTVDDAGRAAEMFAVEIFESQRFFIQVDAPIDAPEASYTLTVERSEGEATQEATSEATEGA
jgi:hypothetical protein